MLLQEFRQNISNTINTSNLPIDAVYYVLKDVLNEVADIMNQQLRQEQMAAAQEEKSEVKAEETEAAADIEKED